MDLVEVRDLPGRETTGGQREHDLVDPVQAALALAHDDRAEAGVAGAASNELLGKLLLVNPIWHDLDRLGHG